MAQIIHRMTDLGLQDSLELSGSGEQIGRKMCFGSNWRKLRAAVRLRLTVHGTEVPSTTEISPTNFMIGICSGTSSMAKAALTTNFLGYKYVTGGPTLLYYTGGGSPIWVQNGGSPMQPYREVFGTGSGVGVNGQMYISATGSVFSGFGFELTKDSITGVDSRYSMSWAGNFALSNPSASLEDLYNYIDGTGWGVNASGVITFNETSGSLDTFNMYWSGPRNLEISDIVIARVL
jgi:hypothetical protein